jgi:hypothetical protein
VEANRSIKLTELVSQAATHLLRGHRVVDFQPMLRVLANIAKNTWFLAHGGREIYRALVDGLLEDLAFARADDWRELLAFPEKALDWTEADDSRLDIALKRYRDEGVYDDIVDCTTLDEIVVLRDSLEQLSTEFGLDFARHLENLDEQIAEREVPDDEYTGGTGVSTSVGAVDLEVTDEDIRQMFSTLRESD